MRLSAGMANNQGNVDLRIAQDSNPVIILAWLGLISSRNQTNGSAQLAIWGDPRYTTNLVALHRPCQEENCSKDGYAILPPE